MGARGAPPRVPRLGRAGEALDRGVALWLGASLLGLAVCALRWREGASAGLLRASAGATAVMLALAAWWLRAA